MSMYQKPENYVKDFVEEILSQIGVKSKNEEVTASGVRLYVDYQFGKLLIEAEAPGNRDSGRDQLKKYMKSFGCGLGLLIDIPSERYYVEYPKPSTKEVCYEFYLGVDLSKDLIYPIYERCFKRSEIDIARKELVALLKMINELNLASLEPKPEIILSEVKGLVNRWESKLLELVKGTSERVKLYRSIWERNMELLYGKEVLKAIGGNLDNLFVDLTIYVTLLKVLGATVLESIMGGGRYTIPLRLASEGYNIAVEMFWKRRALQRFNINYLFDRDEYDWIFAPEVAEKLDRFYRDIGKELAQIDWSKQIDLDLLKRVYQNIIDQSLRRQLGEFYTPDWLAKLIVWRALHILVHGKPPEDVLVKSIDEEIVELINEFYERNKKNEDVSTWLPRFVDPTCGSFTFGVQYLNALLEWYSRKTPDINPIKFVRVLLNNVIGIDLNPVATITAKVNYLLQIYRLLTIRGKYLQEEPMIPIFRVDLVAVHEMNRLGGDSDKGKIDLYFKSEKKSMSLYIPLTSIGIEKNRIEVLRKEGLKVEKIHIKRDEEDFEEYYVKLSMPRTLIDKMKRDRVKVHRALVALASMDVEGFEREIETEKAEIKLDVHEREALKEIVKIASVLEKHGLDNIWYSVLVNHILVYIESMKNFDLVLGNLPWVNVSKYPKNYRDKLREIAKELGVNPPKEAAKKLDVSVILFAISTKYLLKRGKGVVGLMIPASIFRGLHGTSWRSFFIDNRLEVHEVFDLEEVKPFEGAQNQPGVILACR